MGTVTEVLLARCVSIQTNGSTGGRATAQPVKRLPRQLFGKSSPPSSHMHFSSQSMYEYLCRPTSVERASPIFPPSAEISFYRQESVLAANLNATCEYAVVTRHDCDVRKCRSKAVAIHG